MSLRWALRVVAAMGFLFCSSFFRPAYAETKRVLFIVEQPTSFSERLRAEVEAMGFEVAPVQTLDAAGSVVAAVRVVETPPPRRVELWVAQSSGGTLTLNTVVTTSPNDDQASQAVRASEQLRAFFQPLRERDPNANPPAAAQAVPQPPASPPPAWTEPRVAPTELRSTPRPPFAPKYVLAASVAVPVDASGAGLDALLQGRWLLTRLIGIGGVLAVPIVGSTVHSGDNAASLLAALVDAELSFTLVDSGALRFAAVGGAAVVWVRTKGAATSPYTSRSDDAFVALPLLGMELAPALGERIRVCLGARLGVSLPKVDVAFAGQRVASWGQPLALLSAGVSLDF